jgi:CHASE3 domain sensor protein
MNMKNNKKQRTHIHTFLLLLLLGLFSPSGGKGRSLKMILLAYFGIIALLVGVVGYMGFDVANQVSELGNTELPMEQNLREVEVSVWEMIHAANSFRLTGEDSYEGLYNRQVNDVEEFFPKYVELTDTREEQGYISEFNYFWNNAKEDGNAMIESTKKQREKELEFFNKVDDADDVIDTKLQTLSLSLEQEQNLREVEVSVWEAIHAVEQFTSISGKAAAAAAAAAAEIETLYGKETFEDIYERQKDDVANFWAEFKANPPVGASSAIVEFDELWEEAVLAGDEVIRLNDDAEDKFVSLFNNIDKADEVIDFKMQEFIRQRIENQDNIAARSRNLVIVVTVLGFFFSIALGLFVSSRITKPLSQLSKTVDEINKGNFNAEIEKTSSIKEINELADSLDRIMKTMKVAVLKMRQKKK